MGVMRLKYRMQFLERTTSYAGHPCMGEGNLERAMHITHHGNFYTPPPLHTNQNHFIINCKIDLMNS
jgi:hypothetical protein